MKKILITGASGFLGQLAISFFKNYDVYLIDKITEPKQNIKNINILNYKDLNNYTKKIKPDVILHFASDIFDSKEKDIWDNNILGTSNILQVAEYNDVKQIIFTSTFSIFEKNYKKPISEIEPISAKNIYGISKAESERILFSSRLKNNIVIFRCPIIVDKKRAHRLGIFFEFLKDSKKIWLVGDGNNKVHFLAANDLFKAIEKSFILKGKFVFNLGCEKVMSLKDTFKYMIKKTKSKSTTISLNKKLTLFALKILTYFRLIDFTPYHNAVLVSNLVLDISRAKKILNFKSKFSNAELLLDAYKYYIKIDQTKNKKFGSDKKPKMGFFSIIKFFS